MEFAKKQLSRKEYKMVDKIDKINELGENSMVLYKIVLLDEKIAKMKNELNGLIENDADKEKILELSQKINILVLEYMKLKRRIESDFVER